MFTGLIEEVGTVRRVERAGADLQRLEIAASAVLADAEVGDSLNVNGACQTAVAVGGDSFWVESVAETLRRTTLGRLRPGDGVNLERSLRPTDRLGGHLVLGHVDGVGSVRRLETRRGEVLLEVLPPPELARYVAAKGAIAVDGISLTVVAVAADGAFTIALIPHTLAHTNLRQVRPGDGVNLEVDVVARYVERLLGGARLLGAPAPNSGLEGSAGAPAAGLTLEGLRDLGYR